MTAPIQDSKSTDKRAGLFAVPGGRSLLVTFILVTTLFLLWGFCNGMLDILNKHFQIALHIPAESSAARINIAQTCNGLGWILGPIVGGHFVFRNANALDSNACSEGGPE